MCLGDLFTIPYVDKWAEIASAITAGFDGRMVLQVEYGVVTFAHSKRVTYGEYVALTFTRVER